MGVVLAVLLILLIINGVFVMAELAVMTFRSSRLQQLAAKGSGNAATALALRKDPTRFLSTTQVGITVISIVIGAYAEKALTEPVARLFEKVSWLEGFAGGAALATVLVAVSYVSLVLGELVPKRLALAYPEAISMAIARPLAVISRLGALPVQVLSWSTDAILRLMRVKPRAEDDVSEEDVRAIVARAASTGVFTPQEHLILQRVLRVGDLTVRDLMVPRTDIAWVPESTTIDELRILVGTSPFSHFPVCKESIDELTGVVHIKDLISYGLLEGARFTVGTVARKPVFVPETMPALRALELFKSTKSHIVFIVDEHGGTLGLVTFNDITTSLVGDITRKGEQAPPGARRRHDGSWLIDGRLPLHELIVTLAIAEADEESSPDVSTAAGLALALLGHIPTTGEHTDWNGWRFEVVDMDGARIDQLMAYRVPEPELNTPGEPAA
jgi:putative hemolysin